MSNCVFSFDNQLVSSIVFYHQISFLNTKYVTWYILSFCLKIIFLLYQNDSEKFYVTSYMKYFVLFSSLLFYCIWIMLYSCVLMNRMYGNTLRYSHGWCLDSVYCVQFFRYEIQYIVYRTAKQLLRKNVVDSDNKNRLIRMKITL